MSIDPYVSYAVVKMRSTSSAEVTSAATNVPPSSSAMAAPVSGLVSTATILAPSAASRRAEARPIPLPAPVMTATRPLRRSTGVLLSVREGKRGSEAIESGVPVSRSCR